MRRMMTIWMTASLMLVGIGQASAVPVFMCNDDSQCDEGSVCVEGDCKIPCTSDDQCDDGFGCMSGGDKEGMEAIPAPAPCPADEPDCEEAKPEPPPTEETEGFCEPLPASCTSDADCADDEHCAFGPTTGTSSGSAGSPPSNGEGSDPEGVPPSSEGDDEESADAPMPGEPAEGTCMPGSGSWDSECESDDDCPMGMLCEELGSMGTTVSVPECNCPVDEPDCDCGDGDAMPPVESEAYYGCVPAPCDTDADCTDGLVCVTNTWDECAPTETKPSTPMMPDCDPDDADCEPKEEGGGDEDTGDDQEFAPQEEDCETVTESYCMPPYFAPCEVDDDCGEGFSCVEEESCGCTEETTDTAVEVQEAGAEAASSDASTDEPVDPDEGDEGDEDDCSCELTGDMICELQDLPCSDDEDCSIEGWTCMIAPSFITCTVDGETGEEICSAPETSEGQCVPPSWGGQGVGMGFADSDTNAAAESSGPADGTTGDDDEANAGDDPEAPPEDGDGTEEAEEPEAEEPGTDTDDEGGCQGGSPSQGGLMALMLLAMAVLTRRERVTVR